MVETQKLIQVSILLFLGLKLGSYVFSFGKWNNIYGNNSKAEKNKTEVRNFLSPTG